MVTPARLTQALAPVRTAGLSALALAAMLSASVLNVTRS